VLSWIGVGRLVKRSELTRGNRLLVSLLGTGRMVGGLDGVKGVAEMTGFATGGPCHEVGGFVNWQWGCGLVEYVKRSIIFTRYISPGFEEGKGKDIAIAETSRGKRHVTGT